MTAAIKQLEPGFIVHDERLAHADDDAHPRRAWWLELHTGADLRTGTTIEQIERAVERAAKEHHVALPDGFEEEEGM